MLLLLLLLIRREDAVFRVYVVMPLLPGFEGKVGSQSGTALHAITHWNYASICRYVQCAQATHAIILRPHHSFPRCKPQQYCCCTIKITDFTQTTEGSTMAGRDDSTESPYTLSLSLYCCSLIYLSLAHTNLP